MNKVKIRYVWYRKNGEPLGSVYDFYQSKYIDDLSNGFPSREEAIAALIRVASERDALNCETLELKEFFDIGY